MSDDNSPKVTRILVQPRTLGGAEATNYEGKPIRDLKAIADHMDTKAPGFSRGWDLYYLVDGWTDDEAEMLYEFRFRLRRTLRGIELSWIVTKDPPPERSEEWLEGGQSKMLKVSPGSEVGFHKWLKPMTTLAGKWAKDHGIEWDFKRLLP